MRRGLSSYLVAIAAVAAVTWATVAMLPVLGLASAALLFLLPVLLVAPSGGVGPGLLAAVLGAGAYNWFLLEPRFTFRVHQLDNLVSVFVLGAVALVTSRLATRLKAREAEAIDQARCSAEQAGLAAVLAAGPPAAALEAGLAWLGERYGATRLIAKLPGDADSARFSSLDLSAAAWALHNGDCTGHGTPIMAAAEWSMVPTSARGRRHPGIAAVARPADGSTRSEADLAQLGRLCLLIGQCRDRAELEAERQRRERLEEGDRLRRAFLASLAHDFRTPLTVITGRLELLGRTNPEAQEALAQARRLDRTMQDLLGAARLEANALAPALESVDPVDAVAEAVEAVAPGKVTIVRTVPADLPFIRADPVLLHHILINLLDNAVRHAASRVEVSAAARGDAVSLSVRDDGPGIAPQDRAAVFERFTRLEGDDGAGGSGLGLAIVKGFAQAMGMEVTVDPAPGPGACFVLAIPAAPVPVPGSAP